MKKKYFDILTYTPLSDNEIKDLWKQLPDDEKLKLLVTPADKLERELTQLIGAYQEPYYYHYREVSRLKKVAKEYYAQKERWDELVALIVSQTLGKLLLILENDEITDYSGGREFKRKLQPKDFKDIIDSIKKIQDLSKDGIDIPDVKKIVIEKIK